MTWVAENIGTLALMVAVLVWVFMYHTTRRELERSYRAFDELVKETTEDLEVRRQAYERLLERQNKLIRDFDTLSDALSMLKKGDN